jgi:uncharacterized membrane protein
MPCRVPSHGAKRDAGASLAAFPRGSVGTITRVPRVCSKSQALAHQVTQKMSASSSTRCKCFSRRGFSKGNFSKGNFSKGNFSKSGFSKV